jgi:RNA-directed DNA polymerase
LKKTIIETTSDYIGWNEAMTQLYADKAATSYKRYEIKKKSGGKRTIYHPSKKTKSIQYALIETIFLKIPVHSSAAAYKRNLKSPLLENAKLHSPYPYSVRVDAKDFFPSIVPRDIISIVNTYMCAGKIFVGRNTDLNKKEEEFLKKVLFVFQPGKGLILGIGSPSSPIVSNIVMHEIDCVLWEYANKKGGAYSRYADDFIFSTNRKGECNSFVTKLDKVLKDTSSPSLTINGKKTLFMSRGTRKTITGLFVTPDGNITIGRKKKRYVKKLVFEFIQGNQNEESRKYLHGYLSYILDVDPDFFNSLVIKYGHQTVSKAMNISG